MGGGGLGIFPPDSGAYLHAVDDSNRGPRALAEVLALRIKEVDMKMKTRGKS